MLRTTTTVISLRWQHLLLSAGLPIAAITANIDIATIATKGIVTRDTSVVTAIVLVEAINVTLTATDPLP